MIRSRSPLVRSRWRTFAFAGALSCGVAPALLAQGAIDPYVAPRAVEMARGGERAAATEYLGRYLATQPDDGRAWLELGRFYLLDARDWHARGHAGAPDGAMVLDFAVTAFDQAVRLQIDSAPVLRDQARMARALLVVEDSGWHAAWADWARPEAGEAPLPDLVLEFGANLAHSCPANGVILTGSDLETFAVWNALLVSRLRPDLLPVIPNLYATDARYRAATARDLGVDPSLGIRAAMTAVSARRPVCATPLADSAAVPAGATTPVRLTRVAGTDTLATASYLTFTAFIGTARAGRSVWFPDVLRSYVAAARENATLCGSIFRQVTDHPDDVCR